ncbi:AzlD domain-containing protein [Zophobihabitans entericus]|uniref:AzlD domain-containing protein n=1 Tax=Zophobihabitans entericus TaxID=1635327 RepID=A0A6G9IBQ0_9GAMM|nr:AzlD domain-containing protein [Zophobihabitans entericus]QIQ21249.1 AzlD domain-containing protein [Zophobihabitans entericus]
MNLTTYSLLVILGCGIVTWLPRVIPFMLIRKLQLPDVVVRFLSYVPVCILTALFVQSLLVHKDGQFPGINQNALIASVPTIIAAIITKNLLWIVVVGMAAMAGVRYFT